ncbi:hypothetical protein FGO68_gene5240 [Halteria grandinella]|uniref:Aromatic amino acid beta-eliminating lyase/threonine aldolase domain-containing protein n=1 Tax=Halteria grandinella TaxID=5974 RepID=A0A8J8NEP1_HALGN|nr:hypothetical protein FGO68_gene5240 [Halteria grandinella]
MLSNILKRRALIATRAYGSTPELVNTENLIDLRSDTVTRPTKKMREAMASAKVGDDVYGDDPTMNALEGEIAKLFGKEKALFVPSGTQSNLIGMMINVKIKGEGAILGHLSHVYNIERGGISAVGGIHPIVAANQPDGTINLEDIQASIPPNSIHLSQPRVIALESTHNLCGGSVLRPKYIESVKKIARKHKLRMHLDGARCLNAAAFLDIDPAVMVKDFNTVNFCLSKGMGCPVGSLVIGNEEDIAFARVLRKMLGGQMRQVGILAACGLVSLDGWKERLNNDRLLAQELATKIFDMEEYYGNDPATIESNIFRFAVKDKILKHHKVDHAGFCKLLSDNGVLMNPSFQNDCIRIVTHSDFKEPQIDKVIKVFKKLATTK